MNAHLFREREVRGTVAEGLTEAFAERLGRALGTLARRRSTANAAPHAGFVIGRAPDDALMPLRDGLVRGLVLTGQHVIDLGVVPPDEHARALGELARPAGVFLAGPDEEEPPSAGFEIHLGGEPLVGSALEELREIASAGDFSAGVGRIELRSAS